MTLHGDHLKGFVDHVRAFNTEFCLCRGRFPAQHQHSKKISCLNQQGQFRVSHLQPTGLASGATIINKANAAGEKKTITRVEGRTDPTTGPTPLASGAAPTLRQSSVNRWQSGWSLVISHTKYVPIDNVFNAVMMT